MTSLNSSGPLGNVISRLSGLKNVRGRSVMPGAEFLQELEDETPDVSGTAPPLPNFANFTSPTANLPENDLGGELTPQSYDVRANAVTPPESPQSEEEGFGSNLRKLGANLWNSFKEGWTPGISDDTRQRMGIQSPAQTPAVETEQVDMPQKLSPTPLRAKEPEQSPGFWGAISDYVNPTKRSQMAAYNNEISQDAQLLSQGKNPDEVRLGADAQQNLTHEQKKAVQEPWQYGAYGSAQQVANSPVLQAEFKQFTGMDFEPQIAAQVQNYEEAMKGIEDSYSGLQTELSGTGEEIRQRIMNNQSTDADKYYIGLALLMPLIVGGIFGKEAGLGALAGGAKGFADVLGGKQKSIREDEASLMDINKQQGALQEKMGNMTLERAKLEPTLRKNLPEDPKKHLIGMQRIEFPDPVTGNPTEAYEILPGFVAKSQFVNTEKGRERMEKAASDLADTKSYVESTNDLTGEIVDIISQLEDKPWWKKAHIASINSILPGSLSGLTDEVNYQGQMLPAGPLLEHKIGILKNQYAHAQDLGQLDRGAQSHLLTVLGNPTNTLLTPKDVTAQMLSARKFIQDELLKNTKNKGFYPEFVIRDMESANNPLFQKLNQSEDQKYNDQLKRKAFQGEMNYAQ